MLHFSCIDYEEDTQSGRVLSGYKHQKQYFSQLWYFDYNPSLGKWQADFIQPKDSAKSAWGLNPKRFLFFDAFYKLYFLFNT